MRKWNGKWITMILLVGLFLLPTKLVLAADQIETVYNDCTLQVKFRDNEKVFDTIIMSERDMKREYRMQYLEVSYQYAGSDKIPVRVTSSNPSVATIEEEDAETFLARHTYDGGYGNNGSGTEYSEIIYYQIEGYGCTTLTISIGEQSMERKVVVMPQRKVTVESVVQTSNTRVCVSWKNIGAFDGYIIRSAKRKGSTLYAGYEAFKSVATVMNAKQKSIVLPLKKVDYVNTRYEVIGIIKSGNRTGYFPDINDTYYSYSSDDKAVLTPEITKPKIRQLATKNNTTSLVIEPATDVKQYNLYVAKGQTAQYSLYKSYLPSEISNMVLQTKPGICYGIKLEVEYDNGILVSSNERKAFIPIKGGKAGSFLQNKIMQNINWGNYRGYAASIDTTYYYEKGDKFHVVNILSDKKKLQDVTLDANMKFVSQKNVKLGKYDTFGGFYHAKDGKQYVLLAYYNGSENKNKTVIRVVQYDDKWKKKKSCDIKSNVKNYFEGIVTPMRSGNCSMDMIGDELYIFTSRTMFKTGDGLNHQSNIAFQVNTKTMKYKNENHSYVSHSFNQLVKYQDGSLYQVDHGDAYPRAVVLTITNQYGTANEETSVINLLKIVGTTGDNYTGVCVGGLAIGNKNALVCGISSGQDYKIAGKKGNTNVKNVFLSVVNRNTGKAKLNWITTYNPKKSGTTVSEVRMVPITDEKFALLYNTTQKNKTTLHCLYVNENGKKLKEMKYKNMKFDASSQPILYKGYIQWTCAEYTSDYSRQVKGFKIPVVK